MTRRFTDDQRREAVDAVARGELTISEVTGALGITAGTFARWRRRFSGQRPAGGPSASEATPGVRRASNEATESPAEHSRPSGDPAESLLRSHAALSSKIDYDSLLPKIDYDSLFPKIDTSALLPKIDTSALLPKIDTSALLPKIDTSALLPKIDTSALLPKIDTSALLPKIDTSALLPKIDYDSLFPKIDTSALLPKIDYDSLFPKIDTSALLPKIDYDSLFPKIDTSALLPKIDYDSLFPKIDYERLFSKPDFRLLGEWATELRKRWWPPNWPTDTPDFDVLNEILNEDGIPLVWVPRAEIVEQLLSATDRAERISILTQQRDAVIIDCRETASALGHERIASAKPLVLAAISALAGEHHEAAQALSVVVAESALKVALAKSYSKISHEVRIDAREVGLRTLRYRAALAPVARFYTPYYATAGEKPEALSRHVSVHFAEADHYTEENALLAVLLMTSVLRALDDYWARVEPSDDEGADVTL